MSYIVVGVFRASNDYGVIADNITDLRMLNLGTLLIEDFDCETVKGLLNQGVEITNITLDDTGRILGSQGSLSRYPTINKETNRPVGRNPITIVYRLENGKYSVCDYAGNLLEMGREEVIDYGLMDGLTNAKLEPLSSGYKLSPINIEFLADPLTAQKARGDTVKKKLQVFVEKSYELDDKYHAKLLDFKLEKLILPKGVLGIQAKGFKKATNLKEIVLPPTLEFLGTEAFAESGITKLIIPEGVTEIPLKCFYGCSSLREIELPNSLVSIKRMAFTGCIQGVGGLTIIMGKRPKEIAYGAIPTGITIKRKAIQG